MILWAWNSLCCSSAVDTFVEPLVTRDNRFFSWRTNVIANFQLPSFARPTASSLQSCIGPLFHSLCFVEPSQATLDCAKISRAFPRVFQSIDCCNHARLPAITHTERDYYELADLSATNEITLSFPRYKSHRLFRDYDSHTDFSAKTLV